MVKKKRQKPRASTKRQLTLPPGIELLRTLKGHQNAIFSVAFAPQGGTLASGSADKKVKLWDAGSGRLLRTSKRHRGAVLSVAFDSDGRILASAISDGSIRLYDAQSGRLLSTLRKHQGAVLSIAFDPHGETLASGSDDNTVKLWDALSGKLLLTLEGHQASVRSTAFDPHGETLVSGSNDKTVKLWDARSGGLLRTFRGHRSFVTSVAFDPGGQTLASGSNDNTIKLWDAHRGKLLRTLEGHTNAVADVGFSPDGRLLVSISHDHTIRLWSCATWETLAIISRRAGRGLATKLAFHPTLPMLAAVGEEPATVQFWQLDLDALLGEGAGTSVAHAIYHTTAKVVLLGDSGVGKSTLGYRLIHGTFKEQPSTHGQQFWVFPALGHRRGDGTECEVILWDFAGQSDYRLAHTLFVDNADLALLLFDNSNLGDPLQNVDFWLGQLRARQGDCPIILVATRTDRGGASLTREELRAFCEQRGITGPIATSARTGAGLDELIARMKSMIPWDDKPATVTTRTFKRIKDYVLRLKEERLGAQITVTLQQLRAQLVATDTAWHFTDAEMMTAAAHLENYGYVKRLRTSHGEDQVLLQPERLNNLASSLVLEARRNPKGLGAIEEKRLLAGGYEFPELRDLAPDIRGALLDAAVLLFLEHNVCFREADPLRMETYLVFPELINLKKPAGDDAEIEDGVTYTVSGATENVFASLAVLLGYTHTFTRTAQWKDNARYEVGDGLVCTFRQAIGRDGEVDLVLGFAPKVGRSVRTLFQGLFESFLARRNLTVTRHEVHTLPERPFAGPIGRARSVEGCRRVYLLQSLWRESELARCGGANSVSWRRANPSGLAASHRRAAYTF